MSTVSKLLFLVEELQWVHVMATICLTNTHVTRSELETCPLSFAADIYTIYYTNMAHYKYFDSGGRLSYLTRSRLFRISKLTRDLRFTSGLASRALTIGVRMGVL